MSVVFSVALFLIVGVGIGSCLTLLICRRARKDPPQPRGYADAQTVLDALPDPIFVNPFPGMGVHFTHFNTSACEFLGRTREELMETGPGEVDYIPYEERLRLKAELENSKSVRFETIFIHKDGHRFPGEICASLAVFSGQTVAVAVARSLEDQKRREAELRQAIEQLRQTLHILCHDLANPLGALNGMLHLHENDEQVSGAALSELVQISEQTIDLVNLVRELRKIEEGKARLSLKEVSLAAILRQAIRAIQPHLDNKGLALQCDLDDSLRVRVEPVSFLNSVLANILTNAVKFSLPGGSIFVGAKADGPFVRVEIRDQGIGMSSDLIARIFNPAERTSRSGTVGETGTGFGMPLVKKFVELYGGSIRVDSTPRPPGAPETAGDGDTPFGTTIALTLPSASGQSPNPA
jgi:PAS domain S-box-containing protein